jgi:hypothetical protein
MISFLKTILLLGVRNASNTEGTLIQYILCTHTPCSLHGFDDYVRLAASILVTHVW